MRDGQKRGLALLATLVALMWGAKDWIADVWQSLKSWERAAIVVVSVVVLGWVVIWPLARWLWPIIF